MSIELHPSLNIVAGGGILCSPSSVTSDYHSSTASTITNNSSLNYPPPEIIPAGAVLGEPGHRLQEPAPAARAAQAAEQAAAGCQCGKESSGCDAT